MGWLSRAKDDKERPKPGSDLWIKCKSCSGLVFKEYWKNSHSVCPKCGHHERITAWERISITIDSGTFEEMDESITPGDPLGFVDGKGSYADKVAETKKKRGLNESVVTGVGKIKGVDVAVGVMDFRFMGGSLGSGTGEKILRVFNTSVEKKIPSVIFASSGGARMQEGMLSLMQMAKTCAGVKRLNNENIPFISVLTHPTTGGVSASFAMVGDINIAEPGALIGFAGRRVIEQTISQKLPEDFQSAEYLMEHGFVDMIVPRPDMKKKLALILSYYNR